MSAGCLMSEATLSVVDSKSLLALFGARDQHLRRIREALQVSIFARDGQLHVEGEPAAVAKATDVLENLQALVQRYGSLSAEDVSRALGLVTNGKTAEEAPVIDVMNAGRKIRPRTPGQIEYVQAIRDARRRLLQRPRRHRQDLPGRGPGGGGPEAGDRPQDRAGSPGGRGRREPRLSARRSGRQDQPLPAAAAWTPCGR